MRPCTSGGARGGAGASSSGGGELENGIGGNGQIDELSQKISLSLKLFPLSRLFPFSIYLIYNSLSCQPYLTLSLSHANHI